MCTIINFNEYKRLKASSQDVRLAFDSTPDDPFTFFANMTLDRNDVDRINSMVKDIYDSDLPSDVNVRSIGQKRSCKTEVLMRYIDDLMTGLKKNDEDISHYYYMYDYALDEFLLSLQDFSGESYSPGCYEDVYTEQSESDERDRIEACLKSQYKELYEYDVINTAGVPHGKRPYDKTIYEYLENLKGRLNTLLQKLSPDTDENMAKAAKSIKNQYMVTRLADMGYQISYMNHTKECFDLRRSQEQKDCHSRNNRNLYIT